MFSESSHLRLYSYNFNKYIKAYVDRLRPKSDFSSKAVGKISFLGEEMPSIKYRLEFRFMGHVGWDRFPGG